MKNESKLKQCRERLYQTVDRLEMLLRDNGVRMAWRIVRQFRNPPLWVKLAKHGYAVRIICSGRHFSWWYASDHDDQLPELGWLAFETFTAVDDICSPMQFGKEDWEQKILEMNRDLAARLRRCLDEPLDDWALDLVRSNRFRAGIDGHDGEER